MRIDLLIPRLRLSLRLLALATCLPVTALAAGAPPDAQRW